MKKIIKSLALLIPLTSSLASFSACSSDFSLTLADRKSTFSVSGGKLIKPDGGEFIIRGVNTPHAYYKDLSDQRLADIANHGFNTVRIVWCAGPISNQIKEVQGRCQEKDMHSVDSLKETLEKVKEQGLVAVLNLQNATGSNDTEFLQNLARWFVRDEVKGVLNSHKDNLIINIANEWHGDWIASKDSDQVSDQAALDRYLSAYEGAISIIRKGGLDHVLIIDGAGYAQDFRSIPLVAQRLMAQDSNIMFSSHLYDVFNTPERVNHVFDTVREMKIPFLIGEFACSHGPGKSVDCETIVKQADGNGQNSQKYGYIAWSYFGNSSDLSDLDIVDDQGVPKVGWGEFITQAVGNN